MTLRSHQPQQPGHATIGLIVGGTFQQLARHPDLFDCDALLYADSGNETRKIPGARNVHVVELAPGETIATLLAKVPCSPATRAELMKRPSAKLSDGMCQLRIIGALAVQLLLSQPGFGRLLRDKVLSDLLILHGGVIKTLTIYVFASTAGGVGGPGALPIAERIVETALEHLNCNVETHLVRVGSLTYESVGERVHLNGAAATIEDIAWICSARRQAREVRKAYFFELPMVEGDSELRGRHVRQVTQALFAEEVVDRFATTAPNDAVSGRFGGLKLLRFGHATEIADNAVVRQVARQYHGELRAIMRASSAPAAEVRFDFEQGAFGVPRALERLTHDGAADRAAFDAVAGLSGQVTFQGRAVGEIRFADGRSLPLAAVRKFAALPQVGVADYRPHLEKLTAIQQGLHRAIVLRKVALAQAERDQAARQAEFDRAAARLYAKSTLQWLFNFVRNLFADPAAAQAEVCAAAERVVESARRTAKVKVELSRLTDIAAEFEIEAAHVRGRFVQAIEVLAEFVDDDSSLQDGDLIRPASLDPILDDVLKAVGAGDRAEVVRLLSSRIESVTMAGLAQIVGADEPRTADVAELLVDPAVAQTVAPPWGANPYHFVDSRFAILPRISDDDLDELRDHVRRIDESALLLRCNKSSAGANLLHLSVSRPVSIHDVVSRFVGKYLKEAQANPELYFPHGLDVIREAGWEAEAEPSATH